MKANPMATPVQDSPAEVPRPQIEEAVRHFCAVRTEEAFNAVVRLASPRLLRYFCGRCSGLEQAEDLAQDVLIAVYRKVESLKDPSLFWPWVYKIAANAHLQLLRRQSSRPNLVQVGDIAEEQFGKPAAVQWEFGAFGEWMSWLEDPDRDVMILRYIEDLEYHEIADMLSMPLGTVKWRIHQAKQKISKRLSPHNAGRR